MIQDPLPAETLDLDRLFLEQVETTHLGRLRSIARGEVLFWQGDLVESIFVVKTGNLKEYTLLSDGRACTYRILGAGGLAGATAYLLGHDHDTITQALDEVQVLVLHALEFDELLARNPCFRQTRGD